MMSTVAMLVTVSVLVLVVPGLLIGFVGGLRGWLLAAAAPLVSYGVIGIAGPLLPAIGIVWSPLALVGSTLLVALLVGTAGTALGRWLPPAAAERITEEPRLRWSLRHHIAVAATVAVSIGYGVFAMGRSSRWFTAVPQWWDAIFHQNAIRFIADSGNSSPSALRMLDRPGAVHYFYPNAYHVLDATVMRLGDWSVPQVANVGNSLIVGSFALAMVALVRQFSGRPALAAATGLLCCAFTSFPFDVLVWGPLFPFTAGAALVPASLALLSRTLNDPGQGTVAVTAVALVGLAALHPSVAIAAAIGGVAMFAQRWVTARRIPIGDLTRLGALALLAAVSV